ncbi:MAG: hypothetical protein GX455_11015 [Phycisphaerae bacterium]|nr:hypothetical protein [Phycisphaerae bacterium]
MKMQIVSIFRSGSIQISSVVANLLNLSIVCSAQVTHPPTATEILDHYAATQDKLKSFIIREETIPIEIRSTSQRSQIHYLKGDGKPTAIIESRSDGQRAKWYNRMWGHIGLRRENTPPEEAATNLHLWDGKTSYQFDSTLKPGHRGILWVNPGKKQFDEIRGCLWGFFYCDNQKRVDTILRGVEKLTVAKQPTQINGGTCWLLETQCKCGRYQIWFDADHDWQIARAYMQKKPGDLWNGGTMPPDSLIYYAQQDIQFKQVDGIWIPVEVQERVVHNNGKGEKYESREKIRRTEVIMNPDHDKLKSFEPTEVLDGATIPFYLNTSGIHHVVDPEFVWLRNSRFHVDAQGHLPKGPDAVIPYPIVKTVRNLDVLAGKGKWERKSTQPVLLCFWDVAQADSQTRVRELALKNEEFSKRGIGVLLVETEPGSREKADHWVITNQIPFVSGSLPPPDDKHLTSERLTEWRIDCLPWLVLANAEQTVVAEGFDLTQLPDMFKRISNP